MTTLSKRTWPRPFALGAAISFVFCCALLILWLRSYWGSDFICRRTFDSADSFSVTHRDHMLSFSHGEIRFSRGTDTLFVGGMAPPGKAVGAVDWSWGRLGVGHMGWESPAPRTFLIRLGFASWDDGMETSFSSDGRRYFSAPIWLGVLLFLILPGVWVMKRMRARRQVLAGKCAGCGYDLRATPVRCPECGMEAGARG